MLSRNIFNRPHSVRSAQFPDPLVNIRWIKQMVFHAEEEATHLSIHLVIWYHLVAEFPLNISDMLQHQVATLFGAHNQ